MAEVKQVWISIDEQLPSEGAEVWCYDAEEGIILGYHNRYGWSHIYGDDDGLGDSKLYAVTHWQPLERPEPPVELESNG